MNRFRLFFVALALTLSAPASTYGQDVAEPAASSVASPARTTGFVAAKTPTEVPGGPLLLAAYGLVWLVLFGYLFSVRRRQEEVEEELRDLLGEARALAQGSGGGEGEGEGA